MYRSLPAGAAIAGCIDPLVAVLDCPVQFAAERLEEGLSGQANQLHGRLGAAHDETIAGLQVFAVLSIDGEDHLFGGRDDFNEYLRARRQNERADDERVRTNRRRQDAIDGGHDDWAACRKGVRR